MNIWLYVLANILQLISVSTSLGVAWIAREVVEGRAAQGDERQAISTDSPIFNTPKRQEANSLTKLNLT